MRKHCRLSAMESLEDRRLLSSVNAASSDALVDTVGVSASLDSAMNDGWFNQVRTALSQLGIRYVRAGMERMGGNWNSYEYADAVKQLAADLGLKVCLATPWDTQQTVTNLFNYWTTGTNAGVVNAVEGMNESYYVPGWAPAGTPATALDMQQIIWNLANPKGLDVYFWTLGGPCNAYAQMPAQANAYSTAANFHPYHWYTGYGRGVTRQNGLWENVREDGWDGAGCIDAVRNHWMQNPNKPLVITEFGWDGTTGAGNEYGVTQEVQAKYLTRAIFEDFNAGIRRQYIYNLMDPPQNQHYFIANGDGTLTQTGQAIKNIISLLKDPGYTTYNANPLDYSLIVDNGVSTIDDHNIHTDEVHKTLLQKHDGTHELVLWMDESSHLGVTASQGATLTLAGGASQIRIYDPLAGSSPIATYGTVNPGGSLRLSGVTAIPDHPLIFEIVPPLVSTPWAPSNLTAVAASSSQINLTWTDNSNNETGFEVERATDSGFTANLTLVTTTAANATSYSNTGLTATTTYYYRVRATNANGDSANTTVNATTTAAGGDVLNGLVHRWQLDGNLNDSSGTTNGSAQNGSVTYGTGKIGQDFVGSSSGSYVTAAIADPGNAFTVSFWLKPTAVSDYNQRVMASNGWGAFVFHTNSTGTVYVGTDMNARLTPSNIPAGTVAADGTWQFFTFTFNSGTGSFYKNGNLVASKGGMSNPTAWGGLSMGSSGSNNINGGLDDVRIYNRNLSAAEVTSVYNAATTTAAKLSGTVIGTSGSYQGNGQTRENVFDGNLNTYFDAPIGDGAWAGLDLGSAKTITQIKYAPRTGAAGRMTGGYFQVSNSADFASATTIFTISGTPVEGVLTSQLLTVSGTWRYIRYVSPNGGWGNIAEMEVWGY